MSKIDSVTRSRVADLDKIRIKIYGRKPATKGSYKVVGHPARLIPDNNGEKAWREYIAELIQLNLRGYQIPRDKYLTIDEAYYLERPKTVKPWKRSYPTVKPDIDKLQRAFHDALTDSGVIFDDGQIVSVSARKFYAKKPIDIGLDANIVIYPNFTSRSLYEAYPEISERDHG